MDTQSGINRALVLIAVAGLAASIGCGETDSEEPTEGATQQLTGELSTDAEADAEVVAVDEAGEIYLFETDGDGEFQLELPVDHTYQIFVADEADDGLEEASRLVFPRAEGHIDQTLSVDGQMESFDLGEVRAEESFGEAEYQIVDAEGSQQDADGGQASEQADGSQQDADGDEANECEDGAPGLFCIHDGAHPGCEGLSVAADASAQAQAGLELAEQARQAAAERAVDADEVAPEMPESQVEPDAIDPDGDVAFAENNPPAEFPGCDEE